MWSPPGTPPLTRLYWPVGWLSQCTFISWTNAFAHAWDHSSSLVLRHCHHAFSATCARDMKERAVILGSGWSGFNILKHINKQKYDITMIRYVHDCWPQLMVRSPHVQDHALVQVHTSTWLRCLLGPLLELSSSGLLLNLSVDICL